MMMELVMWIVLSVVSLSTVGLAMFTYQLLVVATEGSYLPAVIR